MKKQSGVNLGMSLGKRQELKLPDLKTLESEGKKERIQEQATLMNEETQINSLATTVKCTLKPSKVHGIGVFAIRDIAKGEQCFVALRTKPIWYSIKPSTLKKGLEKVYPELYRMILDRWPNVINGMAFLSPNFDARLLSFMNHSDTPNYDPVTDTALTDIKCGDELFDDYRVMPNYDRAFDFLK